MIMKTCHLSKIVGGTLPTSRPVMSHARNWFSCQGVLDFGLKTAYYIYRGPCITEARTVIPPISRNLGGKLRPLKSRNRGVREIRGQLLFTVMTQITDLNGNRSCDNASLHYKTSHGHYASIYSLKLFYISIKNHIEVTKVPQNSLKLMGN